MWPNSSRKQVAKDVWTFSRPFARFGIIPVGGRSTAIKLSSGDVWVMASTPLNDITKAKLDELGPVKYIVGGDAVHHLFLGMFHSHSHFERLTSKLSTE